MRCNEAIDGQDKKLLLERGGGGKAKSSSPFAIGVLRDVCKPEPLVL